MDQHATPKSKNKCELENSKAYIIVEIIEYVQDAVVIKTMHKKTTDNVSLMSFDSGQGHPSYIKPNARFKIIQTIIKSGYE